MEKSRATKSIRPSIMNFPDKLILDYFISIMTNPVLAFPPFIWVLSTWKVARLGGVAYSNYQEKVDETVAQTIKEQICQQFIDPFLSIAEISMPRGHASIELITIMLGVKNSNNLQLLSEMYESFEQGHGYMYIRVLEALLQILIS